MNPQTASIELTSAQILALFSSPVTIIPQPWPGLAVQVISMVLSMAFGTHAYVIPSGAVGVYYGNAAGPNVDTNFAGLAIKQSANTVYPVTPDNPSGIPTASLSNQPLVIAATTANPTTGDGTLRVNVVYAVVPL